MIMETKFNFNSAICTSKEQSERLLALGLKKETADCHWCYSDEKWKMGEGCNSIACVHLYPKYYIPAWSLHRLIEMMPKSIYHKKEDWYKIIYNYSVCYQRGQFSICRSCKGDLYEDIANCIEWLIRVGYFNKEYLV